MLRVKGIMMNFDVLGFDEMAELDNVLTLFNNGVESMYTLISEKSLIIHIPTSQGKDSCLVSLMALEA